MKKLILNILLVSVIAISAFSCKDKDEDKGPSSYFSIGSDTKYNLAKGLLRYRTNASKNSTTGETFYRHEIDLYSEGLTTVNGNASGLGNAVILEITSTTTTLEPGTYTFAESDANNKPFDFWDGLVLMNFSTSTQKGDSYSFTTGKIVVSKSGDVYTIKFDGIVMPTGSATDKAIEGQYVGKLDTYAIN